MKTFEPGPRRWINLENNISLEIENESIVEYDILQDSIWFSVPKDKPLIKFYSFSPFGTKVQKLEKK